MSSGVSSKEEKEEAARLCMSIILLLLQSIAFHGCVVLAQAIILVFAFVLVVASATLESGTFDACLGRVIDMFPIEFQFDLIDFDFDFDFDFDCNGNGMVLIWFQITDNVKIYSFYPLLHLLVVILFCVYLCL